MEIYSIRVNTVAIQREVKSFTAGLVITLLNRIKYELPPEEFQRFIQKIDIMA